jgi:hypothetical protein
VASSAIKSQEVGYFSELSQHRVLNLLISSSPSYFSIQTNLFQHRVLKSFNSQSRRVQYSSVPSSPLLRPSLVLTAMENSNSSRGYGQ